MAHSRAGRHEDAFVWFRRTLDVKPDHLPAPINRSMLLTDVGDLPRAIDHRRNALELDPDNPVSRNHLGILPAENGRLRQAARGFEAAPSLQPPFPDAEHNPDGVNVLLSAPEGRGIDAEPGGR